MSRAQMFCLGIEPGVSRRKAQTKLRYQGIQLRSATFNNNNIIMFYSISSGQQRSLRSEVRISHESKRRLLLLTRVQHLYLYRNSCLFFSLSLCLGQQHSFKISHLYLYIKNIVDNGALQLKEMKACICIIVKQVWLLSFVNSLRVLAFDKHNSLPLDTSLHLLLLKRCLVVATINHYICYLLKYELYLSSFC